MTDKDSMIGRPVAVPKKIAKYRHWNYPGEWFLTDFTMEQVENRLADLERQLADVTAHRDRLMKLVYPEG